MLTFTNPGVLDPRAITTFGINVKEGPTPIGHFGTGLKYAIAVVLRLGGTISIYTEDATGQKRTYDFVTSAETIRGKTFNFVNIEARAPTLDAENRYTQQLGFTTELGKEWEPWMAYRELRSNMMDEGGAFGAAGVIPAPYTEITVVCPEVEEAHTNAGQFFLETAPLWANGDLEIHPAREDGAVFYRGIRVAHTGARKAVYTYNILHEEKLTEDRTIDLWTCSYRIARAVALLDNQELAEAILLAPHSAYETTLSFDYVAEFSPEMREAIRLQKDNAALNISARKRSRALYEDDFVPLALPMTTEQHQKARHAMELFTAFDINVAWTDIRLAKMQEDEEDAVIVMNGILWVSASALNGENWLANILERRWEGKAWHSLREEEELLRIMRQAKPNLAVFQA